MGIPDAHLGPWSPPSPPPSRDAQEDEERALGDAAYAITEDVFISLIRAIGELDDARTAYRDAYKAQDKWIENHDIDDPFTEHIESLEGTFRELASIHKQAVAMARAYNRVPRHVERQIAGCERMYGDREG